MMEYSGCYHTRLFTLAPYEGQAPAESRNR